MQQKKSTYRHTENTFMYTYRMYTYRMYTYRHTENTW